MMRTSTGSVYSEQEVGIEGGATTACSVASVATGNAACGMPTRQLLEVSPVRFVLCLEVCQTFRDGRRLDLPSQLWRHG